MAHRYWRIYITESTSGSDMLVSLYEAEMLATGGSEDLCSGGTPLASHASQDAYKLFDDNNSEYWNNGSPGVACWFGYDFGSGHAVEVGVIRILPRYASQCPSAFQCQWSDDGTTWHDQGFWSGENSWVGAFWKSFTLPPPARDVVIQAEVHAYGVELSGQLAAWHDLGLFARATHDQPQALLLETGLDQGCGLIWLLQRGHVQPQAILLEKEFWQRYLVTAGAVRSQTWQSLLENRLQQLWCSRVEGFVGAFWNLRAPLTGSRDVPWADTITARADRIQRFDLSLRNPAAGIRRAFWNLAAADISPVCPPLPRIALNGESLELFEAALSWNPEPMAWVARLLPADDATFLTLQPDQPVQLTWDGEVFNMLVARKELIRAHSGLPERVVVLEGVARRHAAPRAQPRDFDWNSPVWIRDAVEEALGEGVGWQLPEWRLPAGRLSLKDATPMELATLVAEAVGGVVGSRPDGQLVFAPRYPRPVPEWGKLPVDHLLTDATDLFEIRATGRLGTRINRITVEEQISDAQKPGLWLEIDPASGTGHHFAPDQTVRLLTLASPGVTVHSLASSAGLFMPSEPITRTLEVELAFAGSNRVVLSRPVSRIGAVRWQGSDLGSLTLEPDGRTVTATQTGVALARVEVVLESRCHPLKAPATLNDQTSFAALVVARGESPEKTGLWLSAERGFGPPWREATIRSPLLTSLAVLQARAEAELDRGENLQTTRLTLVHRPEILPGSVVEVHDGWFGAGFKGIVTGVTHETGPKGALTGLEMVRPMTP
ncbi:MAG: discoidin domain-containing protein [Magnetococcales bacterium]|nr:discoidin domain-containing protein [Magnetococcales bacterium]